MYAKALRLTSEQNWLVFHGLSRQMEQEEVMAAIDFDFMVNRRFPWATHERLAGDLERMRAVHELQAKLRPNLFKSIDR